MGSIKTKSWWTTAPGIITAIASLLTAIGGFIIALNSLRHNANEKKTPSDSTVHATTTVIVKDSSKIEGVVGNVNGKNVNVGTNYGHVGDEYNGTKQRKVSQELINKILAINHNKQLQITIGQTSGDPETMNFVNELKEKLKQEGYENINVPAASYPGSDFEKHREILAFPDTIFVERDAHEFYIFVPMAKNYY